MPDRPLLDLRGRLIDTPFSEGDFLKDLAGPALYKLDHPVATAVICPSCGHVAIIPKLPARAALPWQCSACGRVIRLEPPPAVLALVGAPGFSLPPARA